jgi:glycosyltransferase involved in cell wall biosynthesis
MAIRVLDIINYSNSKNPGADSGIRLSMELIHAILSKRCDIAFHLLVPYELGELFRNNINHPNIHILTTNSLSRQKGGSFHFDVRDLYKTIDLRKLDFDVLFINQPELTSAFLEFFNKVHFLDVHSFGYIHWMDWKRKDNVKNRWNEPTNLAILSSIILSKITGCNSEYGKKKILLAAEKWFNSSALEEMAEKLIPLTPGVNTKEIMRARCNKSRNCDIKQIIFPFRSLKYTGFKSLIEIHLKKLWKKRQDFKLLLTNPSDYDFIKNYQDQFPFLEIRTLNRKQYLEELWNSDIIVGCHNGTNQWSLAAVEALCAECIPLFNKSSFFPEIIAPLESFGNCNSIYDNNFYYRAQFSQKLEWILDNVEEQRKITEILAEKIRKYYDWNSRVDDWIKYIDIVDNASDEITNKSLVYKKMEDIIRHQGKCTQETILKTLKWHPKSRQIPWTKYRKRLRESFLERPEIPYVTFESSNINERHEEDNDQEDLLRPTQFELFYNDEC